MAGPPRCELCGARGAPLRCPGCRLTYYCDVSHQKTDWVSIHSQICHLLSPVLRPQLCFHSEKDRKDGKEQLLRKQESLIAVALSRAQCFVWAGQPLEAIPAALQALRSSSRLLGPASLRLLPIYLLLAEASTGAGRPRQAAKYLSQAQWIVLQSPDCSAALQSKLHRGLGLFFVAEGDLDQALFHLANDVYLATAEFGLNSIEVSGGYFHMANIFFHQNKMDAANSLYTEVSSLWHAWLLSSLHGHQRALQARAEASPFSEEEEGSEEETKAGLNGSARSSGMRVSCGIPALPSPFHSSLGTDWSKAKFDSWTRGIVTLKSSSPAIPPALSCSPLTHIPNATSMCFLMNTSRRGDSTISLGMVPMLYMPFHEKISS